MTWDNIIFPGHESVYGCTKMSLAEEAKREAKEAVLDAEETEESSTEEEEEEPEQDSEARSEEQQHGAKPMSRSAGVKSEDDNEESQ